MHQDQTVIDKWSGAAPFWEKHREVIRHMFAPVTQALVDAGQIGPGNSVLDIATGPGEPALGIAGVVGPEGKVVGIDPVAGMVAAARREAERRGLGNVKFEVATTDDLPFANDTFDAVVSRFGVMFVSDPVPSIREMLRVLKPGRKLAFAVWYLADNNPFFYTVSRILQHFVDSPPVAPDAPDAFRYAAPGKLKDVLREAGATNVSERLLQFTIDAPLSKEDFWTVRTEMSEGMREKLGRLSSEQVAEVRRQSIEAAGAYSTGGGMSFPAEVLIVSGTKAGGD